MPTDTFGYLGEGGSIQTLANRITGSMFTMPRSGIPSTIHVYLNNGTGGTKTEVKCAIYKHSDRTLVAVTSETSVPAGVNWTTFTLTTNPTLEKGVEYILVCWSTWAAMNFCYTGGGVDQGHYDDEAYNGFSDPMTVSHENNKYSIYCTFSYTLSRKLCGGLLTGF